MPLTDLKIRAAKPKDKPYKISDGGGLYLLINTNGAKYWRWKYRIQQKEKVLAIGVYPEVTLKQARDAQYEARKKLEQGIDPSLEKKYRLWRWVRIPLRQLLVNGLNAICRGSQNHTDTAR
jgi:hypothetical protein